MSVPIRYDRGSEQNINGTLNGDYMQDGKFKRVVLLFTDPVAEWPHKGSNDGSIVRAGVRYPLYIPPRQWQTTYPTRAQVTQSLGGAFIDSFGYGLPTGSISGTFGWGKARDEFGAGYHLTGIERMVALKKLYEAWQMETIRKGYRPTRILIPSLRVDFEVFWGDLVLQQEQQSPLLVNFTLPFTVIYDWNGPPTRNFGLPPVGVADGATPDVAPLPPGEKT